MQTLIETSARKQQQDMQYLNSIKRSQGIWTEWTSYVSMEMSCSEEMIKMLCQHAQTIYMYTMLLDLRVRIFTHTQHSDH